VFVDRSGRRRRLLTVIGAALAVALLTSLIVLFAGFVPGNRVPLPGWPDAGGHDQPAPTFGPPEVMTTPDGSTTHPASSTSTTAPAPTTANPGQGDEHRRTARPSKSPGKP